RSAATFESWRPPENGTRGALRGTRPSPGRRRAAPREPGGGASGSRASATDPPCASRHRSWRLRTLHGILRSLVEGDGATTTPRVIDFGAGFSLANLAEIMFPCLDAVAPKVVLEIGAFRGELTRVLLEWAATGGVRVEAIDPDPQPELTELAKQHRE